MPNTRNAARDEALAKGEKWYFTGEPCKNGHVCERLVSCHKCKMCDAERQKARRDNDPEFRKRASERHAAWRAENLDYALAESARWYEENKERALENSAIWIANNNEAVRAIRRRYYANNPSVLAYAKARQRRVRKATPAWADMSAIRAFYENCPPDMQVDHVVPINGKTVCGLHVVENFQYLTISENSSKGNRWSEWAPDGSDDSALFLFEPFQHISDQSPKE